MRSTFALFAVTLVLGCGTMSAPTTPTAAPAADDLRWIDTLRALDERADRVVGAANFQSSRKELSAFGDEAAHGHRKRSEEIKSWRDSAFPKAIERVELPPCAQQEFDVGSKPSDLQILDTFIAHRECVSSYASQALANVRSTTARHVLEEAARTFEAELKQLRTWRETWR
ncbi:MAG TPA: hypothetical protein VJZ00_11180 [Thermoanaerobaculia bacterium]|nr:hypothetical protein [Thermoanaerobaculia bacterium]